MNIGAVMKRETRGGGEGKKGEQSVGGYEER